MLPEKNSQGNKRLILISSIIDDKVHSIKNITKVKDNAKHLNGIFMKSKSMQIIISLMKLMRRSFHSSIEHLNRQ